MNASLPPLPHGIGSLTDNESSALDDRYPQSRTVGSRACPTCAGARTFEWYDRYSEHPSSAVVTYDCPCRDQYRLSRWLWYSGVLPRFQKLGWADLTRPEFAGMPTYADYLANIDRYVAGGFGLLFHGPRGTGKTLVSHMLVKDLIGQGMDCYVTTFERMIEAFTAGWSDKEQARWFDRRVRDCKVLMVDDLGRERNKGQGSVGENMLESVIRHRVACQMPTLITTNLDPFTSNTEAAYGGHTLSLLTEASFYVEVDGADSRQAMNERGKIEARSGLTRPVVLK